MYWRSTPEGKRVYTERPCGDEAEDMRADTAANEKAAIAPEGNDFVGTWKRRGFRYLLSAGGNLRSEGICDGELRIWRTGTWSINGKEIAFHFTRYGGPGVGISDAGDAIDYMEKGEYIWTNVNAFSARVGGSSGQWWDTFVRVAEDV